MLDTLPPEITGLRQFLVDPKTMSDLEATSGQPSVRAHAYLVVLLKFELAFQREIGGETYYAIDPRALQQKAEAEGDTRQPKPEPARVGAYDYRHNHKEQERLRRKEQKAQAYQALKLREQQARKRPGREEREIALQEQYRKRRQERERRERVKIEARLARKAEKAAEAQARREEANREKEAQKAAKRAAKAERQQDLSRRKEAERQARREEANREKEAQRATKRAANAERQQDLSRHKEAGRQARATQADARRAAKKFAEWAREQRDAPAQMRRDFRANMRIIIMDLAEKHSSVTRDQLLQELPRVSEVFATSILRELVREGMLRFTPPASYTHQGRSLQPVPTSRQPWKSGARNARGTCEARYLYLDMLSQALSIDDLASRTGHLKKQIRGAMDQLLEEKLIYTSEVVAETYYSYRRSALLAKQAEIDEIQETLLMSIPPSGLCTMNALMDHAGLEAKTALNALIGLQRRNFVEVAIFNRERFVKLTGSGRRYSASQGECVPVPEADIFCNGDNDQVGYLAAIGHLQPVSYHDLRVATDTKTSKLTRTKLSNLEKKGLVDLGRSKPNLTLAPRGREIARFLIGHASLPNPATYLMHIDEARSRFLNLHEFAALCMLESRPWTAMAISHAFGRETPKLVNDIMRGLADRHLVVPLSDADEGRVGDIEWMITFEGQDALDAAVMRGDFEKDEQEDEPEDAASDVA